MRKRQRYPIFASAVIRGKDKRIPVPAETMIAIANISRTGLGLYSYTPVGEGTIVSLDIAFAARGKKERRNTVRGKVVWETKKGALYFSGVALDKSLSPSCMPISGRSCARAGMKKSRLPFAVAQNAPPSGVASGVDRSPLPEGSNW